jgi:arylsulfatase A-like enzyme
VPLGIRHPEHTASAGKQCSALASHLDITPTILGMAGIDRDRMRTLAPASKRHDISTLLAAPASAPGNALGDATLYNYNMWPYRDAEFLRKIYEAKTSGMDVSKLGLKPDLTNAVQFAV